MKQPPQHSWMEPGWSSSDPQPRPYGWAYDEDQGDHHVRQFRKDRQRDAALDRETVAMQVARYAAASFESTSGRRHEAEPTRSGNACWRFRAGCRMMRKSS